MNSLHCTHSVCSCRTAGSVLQVDVNLCNISSSNAICQLNFPAVLKPAGKLYPGGTCSPENAVAFNNVTWLPSPKTLLFHSSGICCCPCSSFKW